MFFTQYTLGLFLLIVSTIHGAQNSNWDEDDFGFNDRQRFYANEDEDGSADDGYVDPRKDYPWPSDDDDLSGDGLNKPIWPGTDSEEGSAYNEDDGYPSDTRLTECEKLVMKMQVKQRRNQDYEYMPRCTTSGAFEEIQCNLYNECWCANNYGQEIPGTRTQRDPSCYGLDRQQRYDEPIIDIEGPIIKEENTGVEGGKPTDGDDGDINIDDDEEPPRDKSRSNEQGGSHVLVSESERPHRAGLLMQPLILAGIIAFAVVCLLCAVLLVMFIVYRMRKKDEGSYALDEPKRSPSHPYQRAPTKEYFA